MSSSTPAGGLVELLASLQHGDRSITLHVVGIEPAPQGSKKPVGTDRQGRVVLIESCRRVKPWRQAVADAALSSGEPMIYGPAMLAAEFLFMRPKGHYGARGAIRPSAPPFHVVRPDGDKLLRSSQDALTGTLLRDDSQVVAGHWLKRYCMSGELPGAILTLYLLS